MLWLCFYLRKRVCNFLSTLTVLKECCRRKNAVRNELIVETLYCYSVMSDTDHLIRLTYVKVTHFSVMFKF